MPDKPESEDSGSGNKEKRRTARRVAIFGILSLCMYLLVFLNQEAVTHHFTKGGVFALATVATALAFSFIHGAFANHTWDLSGIKPMQKKED